MTTSTLTPRQSFRDTLAQVAEQARAILPTQVNGRIESAVTLVLQGDVLFCADGTVEVGSSDPTRYYRLVGPTCTCTDYTSGKAPEGACKHRIAANLQRSVERVLARRLQPEPVVPGVPDLEPWPENDPEPEPPAEVPMPQPLPPPAPALPEAPASVNVRILIAGRECQLTLRDHDETRLLVRLEELLQRFPVPQTSAPASPQGPTPASPEPAPERRFCPKDGAEMQLNQKEGRSWWSHRLPEGGWCKGK
jgi:hypothetical protein